MADSSEWAFPAELQPKPKSCSFDLEAALGALVLVRAEIPEDAFTASVLGTERIGNGVVIRDDGLVLTIGYLITEATAIWLTTNQGAAVAGLPARVRPGDGLRPRPAARPARRSRRSSAGRPHRAASATASSLAGHGGLAHALKARVFAKREFAGYWEYVLDEAVFTAPAHPQWGGAALIGADGRLLGIGSLLVQEQVGTNEMQGNMIVPIDLLEPILADMLALGRSQRPARPWLGMYTTEVEGQLVVAGLADGGPAERAAIQVGDLVLEVAGERVAGLAELFRKVWSLGPPGTEIPLTIAREGRDRRACELRSADRQDFLKKPQLH